MLVLQHPSMNSSIAPCLCGGPFLHSRALSVRMKALFQFADEAGAERERTAHQQRQRIRPARSVRAGLLRFDEQLTHHRLLSALI